MVFSRGSVKVNIVLYVFVVSQIMLWFDGERRNGLSLKVTLNSKEARIIRFLTGPHAGMSAKAICIQAISDTVIPNSAYPHDSGDFKRCQICLKETGIDIQIMKGVSPVWDALVENWDRLTETFRDERGNQGSGEKTYRAVREIIDWVGEAKA